MTLVAFFAVKGGVGVSTCVAQVCDGLASRNLKVSVVDLSGTDQLNLLMGLRADPSLITLPGGLDAPMRNRVRVASPPPALVGAPDGLAFLQAAAGAAEFVVADLSGHDRGVIEAVCARADLSVCVMTADAGSILALPRALDLLSKLPDARVVVNQVDGRRRINADALALFDRFLGGRVLARIRRDEAVNEACAALKPLSLFAPKSAAAKDFSSLVVAIEALRPAAAAPAGEYSA